LRSDPPARRCGGIARGSAPIQPARSPHEAPQQVFAAALALSALDSHGGSASSHSSSCITWRSGPIRLKDRHWISHNRWNIDSLYKRLCPRFPHFYQVVRYLERNALRANLVERAEHWLWSSLCPRRRESDGELLAAWPLPRPANWIDLVNEPQMEAELQALRHCVQRGTPFGDEDWAVAAAGRLRLEDVTTTAWPSQEEHRLGLGCYKFRHQRSVSTSTGCVNLPTTWHGTP
jgi:hypothetical protein